MFSIYKNLSKKIEKSLYTSHFKPPICSICFSIKFDKLRGYEKDEIRNIL